MSNTLSEANATWRGDYPDTARLVHGDVVAAVRALKEEPGDELQIWGSSNLLQTLLHHRLVHRFRLNDVPRHMLGSGRRLFGEGPMPANMRPVDIKVTACGVVLGTYEPAGPVQRFVLRMNPDETFDKPFDERSPTTRQACNHSTTRPHPSKSDCGNQTEVRAKTNELLAG